MTVILGLLIFCLGVYFLGLFFQVARIEKDMTEGVTLLEKYMIVTYSLGDDKGKEGKKEDGEGDAKGAAAPEAKPAPKA